MSNKIHPKNIISQFLVLIMAKDTDGLNMPKFKTMVRNILYIFRPKIKNYKYYFKCRFKHAKKRNVFYLIFEPNRKHPGLADRIKAIISCYDWAKSNGYHFKLYFETPFPLKDYFNPKFNWVATYEELEYSIYDTKIVNENYREKPIQLIPNKQYHCYNYAGHHMPKIFPDSGYKFSDLFNEMFEPCNKLKQKYLDLGIKEKQYVSCHLRFVNALEKFEDTFFDNYLEKEEDRELLINRCKEGIRKVIKMNPNKDIYVFSETVLN